MPLTYEQMVNVLEDFESQNPVLSANANVHGVHLEIATGNSKTRGELDANAFEIRIHVARPLSAATMQFVPKRYSSNIVGIGVVDWRVVIVETPPATPEVLQGHAARQVGVKPSGTVGHNFFVRGVGHCMMSCHHVLAVPNTTGGQDIQTLDPDMTGATWTHTADLQAWRNNETFDYALALYRNDADCQAAYRACTDGTTRGFAGDFASALSFNEIHFKVGQVSRCTTGRLLGVGNIGRVDGIDRRGQLIFERMTQPGDSGSIVVHENTNRIVGLHFAGFDDPINPANSRSFSNPIYRVGFQLVGYYESLSGARVPIYDASAATIPVTTEQSIAAERTSKLYKSGGLDLLRDTYLRSESMIGGLLFLGSLSATCNEYGTSLNVHGTEPLPVSGGDLVRIPVNITISRGGGRGSPFPTYSCLVLYFG